MYKSSIYTGGNRYFVTFISRFLTQNFINEYLRIHEKFVVWSSHPKWKV